MRSTLPAWLTPQGIDLALYPIDGVLRQAISPKPEDFRSACTILKSMCSTGRVEAGIFLIGLLKRHTNDFERLILIADALEWFQYPETVQAFAAELRRVQGSSSTRRYLRRLIEILESFPQELAGETIQMLSSDPAVGSRFRQRLKELSSNYRDGWATRVDA
jgi:hypothetical protein